jgi:HIV Tat-specific factor 1
MSTQLPPPSTGANFTPEAQAALFAADPRIHYSRETGTWRLENEDGSELEYDTAKGTWIALVSSCYILHQNALRLIQVHSGGRGSSKKTTSSLFDSRC